MYSGTDVRSGGYGQNIDNHTGGNAQGTIITIIPKTNSAINWNIFDSISRMLDIAYIGSWWYGAEKMKVRTLKATTFSKMLRVKIILKLKHWGTKNCNLESQIFRLDSHWSESCQLESNNSRRFDKHRINQCFIQYLYNKKDIVIAGIFGTSTFYGTRSTNIYLWDNKWPLITIAWLIIINCDTLRQSYATQQPTQSGTENTSWPRLRYEFDRPFFVELMLLIRRWVL